MRKHLNTLFVTLDGAYLMQDGETVAVKHQRETKLRIPFVNLDGIITFGWDIGCSPQLMAACARTNVTLSFCDPHGRFLAAAVGFSPGNVLLRRQQYRFADDPTTTLHIARHIVAAKISNSRHVLQRAARDHGAGSPSKNSVLVGGITQLHHRIRHAMTATGLETLRGIEGEAADNYFQCFSALITIPEPGFTFTRRSRRPPLDPINALLSFLYSLLAHDCRSAAEASGLDAAVGFLHRDRPGRPSLALDLMEALRPVFADRLAFSLINRRQLTTHDFTTSASGAVTLSDTARKSVLTAWQERKQTELTHPFLNEKITLGTLPHLQARLLARHLRGDLDAYPEFLWR